MASIVKVLGQAAPAATTATDVYTVPSATETVISTIIIANRDSSAGTFRLSVRPNGATQADEHYIAYDVVISANDSTTLTLGITMDAADVLTFRASTADMSVNVFGTELS
jgi:glutamyl-tRNA reductase